MMKNTEDNGTITVTLIADNSNPVKYLVAPTPNNTAQVNVYDDDSPPTIMIGADSGNVVEGDEGLLEFYANSHWFID